MSPIHLHLALNHLPLVGVLFGALALAAALLRRNLEWQRGALALLVLASLTALPAYFSGSRAEEAAERLPGVEESCIEAHEEAAEGALAAVLVLGALSLAAWVFLSRRGSLPLPAVAVLFVACLLALGLLGRAASLGGEIRHPEIRSGP